MINKENLCGDYVVIQGHILKMHSSNDGWEVITNDYSLMKLGFLIKRNYLYKEINKNQNIVAFTKYTFCIYGSGKYQIGNIFNNQVILFPDLETKRKIGFYINEERSIDIEYDEFINKVSTIWEERKPIEGFKFDVEPIHYIKKDDVFL